jgi:pimeloyl-ACP methyl ester carboxylesterase
MGSPLAISTVLEEPMFPIGRRSYLLADPNRESRWMGVELWYPAQSGGGELALYEIIPGAGFTCQAQRDVEAVSGPLVPLFFSHGRSGNRLVYAQMCEALAARGFVIVSCDHPGDTMVEWMFGTALDDLSNERERAADVSFILDALANRSHGLDHPLHLDLNRLAMAGHSYGANTTVAFAGNSSSAIRPIAIAGVEPFLRTLARDVLGRVDVPVLLIGGRNDATTPPSTDMDYAVRHFSPDLSVRCTVLENVGHQGCSDVGLYLEFASQIDGVPDAALAMLETMGAEVTGRAGEPWRPAVLAHVQLLGAWLSDLASAATNVEDFTQLERVSAHFTS